MYGTAKVNFADKQEIPQDNEAEYLGVILNKKAEIQAEIRKRTQKAIITWQKMKPYWLHSKASKKTKIRIWEAIVKSKIMYGLESAQITPSRQAKINTYQLKGIRQILQKQTTYIDRRNTNTKLIEEAEN